jgi:hypothetical protein
MMNIHVKARGVTVNGHKADWHKDSKAIAAMLKNKLFSKEK